MLLLLDLAAVYSVYAVQLSHVHVDAVAALDEADAETAMGVEAGVDRSGARAKQVLGLRYFQDLV